MEARKKSAQDLKTVEKNNPLLDLDILLPLLLCVLDPRAAFNARRQWRLTVCGQPPSLVQWARQVSA